MGRYDMTLKAGGSVLEERRSARVDWDRAVVRLAYVAATFAWVLGTAATGLALVLYLNHTQRPLELGVVVSVPMLAGLALGGLVGLVLVIVKDGRYVYQDVVQVRHMAAQEETAVPALAAGPLERSLGAGSKRIGLVRLTAAQKMALARMIIEARQTTISGRLLETYGVIPNRNQVLPDGRSIVVGIQEDLMSLGLAARNGSVVEITGPGVDYMDDLLPPPLDN